PPELDLARVGAAVAGGQVAVVAQLGQHPDAVAAAGDAVAGLARRRAREPGVDGEAVGGAPVVGRRVAVVARFVLAADAVAADRVLRGDVDVDAAEVEGRRAVRVGPDGRVVAAAGAPRAGDGKRLDARAGRERDTGRRDD